MVIKMKAIKISIIIPAYNAEKYIRECFDSIVNQDYRDYEVIVINDRSTDNTLEICKFYEKKYQNFIVLDQMNQGQSAARNNGVKISRGKYLFFIDSDDYIVGNILSKLVKIMEENDLEMIHFDTINNPRNSSYADKVLTGDEYIKNSIMEKEYDIAPWLNIIKKDFVLKNKVIFKEGFYFEDQLYTFQLFKLCKRMMKINQSIYYYRVNDLSTCNTYNKKKLYDSYNILIDMIGFHNSNDYKFKEDKIILSICLYATINIWLHIDKKEKKIFMKYTKNIPKDLYHSRYTTKINIYLQLASINWKLCKYLFYIERILKGACRWNIS